MERTRIRIAAPAEHDEVPPWWAPLFHERQRTIRRRILGYLGRAERPMAVLQLQQQMSHYSSNEVAYALTTLARSGLVSAEEREVRVEGASGVRIDTTVFFSLAKTPEVVR